MPVRLLSWNIQFFTLSKIRFVPPVGNNNRVRMRGQLEADEMRASILDTIMRYNPDIFVLIEVRSSLGPKGSLIGGQGASGSRYLLRQLRNRFGGHWCLVPPLRLVDGLVVNVDDEGFQALVNERQYTEGISVFYRNDVLDFTGPYIWPVAAPPEGPKRAVPNVGGVAGGAYPNPWATALPPGNFFAAQYEHFFAGVLPPQEVLFTAVNNRRVFRTNFTERATNRNMSVYSLHFPPNNVTARTALLNLPGIPGIANPQPGEAVVVCGDFNVEQIGGPAMNIAAYNLLANGHQLVRQFDTASGPTMYRSAYHARPTNYLNPSSLDNILTKGNLAPANPGIINRVITQVYNGANIVDDMLDTLDEINQEDPEDATVIFQDFNNYGHLAAPTGISDHMPVVLDF